MFRQIIRPETKEDLIIHLPEKYLGKEVEVEATEIVSKRRKNIRKKAKNKTQSIREGEKKEREKELKKAFEFFSTISVDTSNFKFNREEANAR